MDFTQGSFQEILDDPHPPNPINKTHADSFFAAAVFIMTWWLSAKDVDRGYRDHSIEQLYPLNVESN